MHLGSLVPMKLMTAGELPRGDFIYQLKWDGIRMLAFVDAHGVSLQNRKLRIRTDQYPELQRLRKLLGARQAILDGEVVVPAKGLRTSFQSVIRREFTVNPQGVRTLAQELPIHYIVFDMLMLNDQPIVETPLEERLSQLRHTLIPDEGLVSVIEDFSDGAALFAATKKMHLEGIVAKARLSPYKLGERTSLWQKIKHRLRETFTVLGYTLRDGSVNALLLGQARIEGGYSIVGRAGSGLSTEQIRVLTHELPKLRLPQVPSKFPRDVIAVHPHLSVDVEFMEWTEDLVVRAPAIKGFSVGGVQIG